MPIYYALIGKIHEGQSIVLADYTSYVGNFHAITQKLMPRIENNTMKTFELDEYFFHYANGDGITYLCMTDKQYKRKQAFAFLQDIKKALLSKYVHRELERAQAHSMGTFSETLRDKIDFFDSNEVAFSDQSTLLLDELAGLKDQMMENLDKVIERDQLVTVSKQRANSLVEESQAYGSRTRQVRATMKRRRYCYIAIAIGATIVSQIGSFNATMSPNCLSKSAQVVLLILLFSICGITFDKCGNN